MNRTLLTVLAVGGAALIFAADQPKKEKSEFEKLQAKVILLEGRIDQLDAKVASLTRTPRVSFETPTLPTLPESAPPNVGELEVNGLKVYKVPLTQTAR